VREGLRSLLKLAGHDPLGSVPGFEQSARQLGRGAAGWLRFLWLIRASWLIGWIPAPLSNRRTRINHYNRRTPSAWRGAREAL